MTYGETGMRSEEVAVYEPVESLYGLSGRESIRLSVHAVIYKTVHGRCCHMHACVA